jgi:hypothetical protein
MASAWLLLSLLTPTYKAFWTRALAPLNLLRTSAAGAHCCRLHWWVHMYTVRQVHACRSYQWCSQDMLQSLLMRACAVPGCDLHTCEPCWLLLPVHCRVHGSVGATASLLQGSCKTDNGQPQRAHPGQPAKVEGSTQYISDGCSIENQLKSV